MGFHLQGPVGDCAAGVVIAHLAHQRADVWGFLLPAFSPALGGQTGSLGLLQEQTAGQTLLCSGGGGGGGWRRHTLAGAAWQMLIITTAMQRTCCGGQINHFTWVQEALFTLVPGDKSL